MMKKLWPIFKVRNDIEYAFVIMCLSGLMLLTFLLLFATSTQPSFNPEDLVDYFLILLVLSFVVCTTYFFVAIRGFNKVKSKRKK